MIDRSGALLLVAALAGCADGAPRTSGSGTASIAPPRASETRVATSAVATEERFEPCSGTNDKWAGLRAYPSARMLCCHTTNGLPHIFTTVFATEDPLDRVSAFYTDGPAPSASPASRPSLSFRPATAAPPGCVPGAADRSLVVVSEMPPFPH